MAIVYRLGIVSALLLFFVGSAHATQPSDDKKGATTHHNDHPPHDHPLKTVKKMDSSTNRRKKQ